MSEMAISDRKLKLMEFQFKSTAVIAITSGLASMFTPKMFQKLTLVKKEQDQVFFGLVGAVYTAFGISSVFGARNPKKFAPVLLMQFLYKTIWELFVILPQARKKELDGAWLMAVGYILVFIIPDLFCVPFKELLLEK